MTLEKAQEATASAKTEQEFEQILQEQMTDGALSEEDLRNGMSKAFPGANVMVDDPVKRQEREALAQRMRNTMGNYLRNNFHAVQAQQAWLKTLPEPRPQLSRALSDDTLLKLPHPEQLEEYKRRYNILVNGTAKEKRDLLFEALHEAKRGYSRERLVSMSGEEIANDFEKLERLQGFTNAARTLSKDSSLELSEEQKQELLDFETEFDGISNVFTRAKMISNPCYGMVDMENLPENNVAAEKGQEVFEASVKNLKTDEEIEAARKEASRKNDAFTALTAAVDSARMFTVPYLESEIARRIGTDVPAEKIAWLDGQGRQKKVEYAVFAERYEPPVEDLVNGGTLTAILPDGTVKSVRTKQLAGGGLAVYDRPDTLEKYVSAADSLMAAKPQELFSAMDAADPWYIRSSSEFKEIKAQLEKMQKDNRALGNNPTQYQRDQMMKQLKTLDNLSASYIDSKQGKTSMNDREKARLAAVQAVSSFAQRQMHLLDKLSVKLENSVNAQEKTAFAQSYSTANREANQENLAKQAEEATRFERPHNLTDDVHKTTERRNREYVERFEKAGAYKYISCPPSQECGDALEKLHRELNPSLEHLLTASTHMHTIFTDKEQEVLRQDMARLTVFNLVLTERESGGKFNGHAGPFEKALAADSEKLVKSMADNAEFKKRVGDITPERISQFLLKDGARLLSKALIEQSRQNQAQASAPAAPEKSAQKNMENPMQKR